MISLTFSVLAFLAVMWILVHLGIMFLGLMLMIGGGAIFHVSVTLGAMAIGLCMFFFGIGLLFGKDA